MHSESVRINSAGVSMEGVLELPAGDPAATPTGVVLFAHGSGSSRLSPRNNYVARELRAAGMGSLLLDLLSAEEDLRHRTRFNIPLLTQRLDAARAWLQQHPVTAALPLGLFGASTGAAAALQVAAIAGPRIAAVVSRGGRPDLAGADMLARVHAPTLLIVGSLDDVVIELNQAAYAALACEKQLLIVPGATHLFEEAGTLEAVARAAAQWFATHFSRTQERA